MSYGGHGDDVIGRELRGIIMMSIDHPATLFSTYGYSDTSSI